MREIAINTCFGGFSLSRVAAEKLSQRVGFEVSEYLYSLGKGFPDIKRDNPYLIEIIKEMGQDADGECARLKIVEIPDDVDWFIDEYDGLEHVAEKHRTWD